MTTLTSHSLYRLENFTLIRQTIIRAVYQINKMTTARVVRFSHEKLRFSRAEEAIGQDRRFVQDYPRLDAQRLVLKARHIKGHGTVSQVTTGVLWESRPGQFIC